ncbi:MAG: phosphoribosylformylglycinamidine cyclo-ligase, partial [Patescibacteria group bacterium]|nr:phosphoribosylformylglycinamidine cyclo-ligase [Patescibacteria group bacterium]
MDSLKRMAQSASSATDKNISNTTFRLHTASRGESATVIEQQDGSYLAFVMEGLGTKNLVADTMAQFTQKTYYDSIAQDTVAMIVNDLITVGARPVGVMAYWAAGSEDWFTNEKRMEDLVNGWKKACDVSGAVWAGGETPTLSGIIHPATIDLGGSAFGFIPSKEKLTLGDNLRAGDAIVLFASSGIHANGLSLARKIADLLPAGYQTRLPNGKMYGEALLEPTIIYAKLVQELLKNNINIHYMANITGHGWRKLMRHSKEFTYKITSLPPVSEVLTFIKEKAEMSDEESYGNLNMGAGFAIFIPPAQVQLVIETAAKQGIAAYHAGDVIEGAKQVVIEPLHVTFASESLHV